MLEVGYFCWFHKTETKFPKRRCRALKQTSCFLISSVKLCRPLLVVMLPLIHASGVVHLRALRINWIKAWRKRWSSSFQHKNGIVFIRAPRKQGTRKMYFPQANKKTYPTAISKGESQWHLRHYRPAVNTAADDLHKCLHCSLPNLFREPGFGHNIWDANMQPSFKYIDINNKKTKLR